MVSVTAQYAVRALAHLASLAPGETVGGRALASAVDIPQNYLSKILWTLGSAGLIDATRGTGGGYRLRRLPASVHLIEIVELFDKAITSDSCFLDGTHRCGDEAPCAAHNSWRQVKETYLGFLRDTTLASLATHAPLPSATESRP